MTESKVGNPVTESEIVTGLVNQWLEERCIVGLFQRLPASWPTQISPFFPDIRFGQGRFGCLGTHKSLAYYVRQDFSYFCSKLCGFSSPGIGEGSETALKLYYGQLKSPVNLTELACERVGDELTVCCFDSGVLTDYRSYQLYKAGNLTLQDMLVQYHQRLAVCQGNKDAFKDTLEAYTSEMNFLTAMTPEEFGLVMQAGSIWSENCFFVSPLVFALAISDKEGK